MQIVFAPDQVRASGSLVTASGTVAVTTTGAMIPQGQAVLYQPQTIALGGVPVPEGLLPQFAALVNPLIDLRTLRFSPQVAQITLVDGAVILTGTADARALLNGTPALTR